MGKRKERKKKKKKEKKRKKEKRKKKKAEKIRDEDRSQENKLMFRQEKKIMRSRVSHTN